MTAPSSSAITKRPPIKEMFTQFKDFYSKLAQFSPDITYHHGRHAFLHRARVAREQEDVDSFRHLRNELICYWQIYLDTEERRKTDMNVRLGKMLDSDVYPSHEWEPIDSPTRRKSSATAQSPVLLDAKIMAREGIPMTANPMSSGSMIPGNEMTYPQAWHTDAAAQERIQAQVFAQRQAQAQVQAKFWQSWMYQRRGCGRIVNVPSLPAMTPPHVAGGGDPVEPLYMQGAGENSVRMLSGEPGPSSLKRRRVDSGLGEIQQRDVQSSRQGVENESAMQESHETQEQYVGKGKGKMSDSINVVCMD